MCGVAIWLAAPYTPGELGRTLEKLGLCDHSDEGTSPVTRGAARVFWPRVRALRRAPGPCAPKDAATRLTEAVQNYRDVSQRAQVAAVQLPPPLDINRT